MRSRKPFRTPEQTLVEMPTAPPVGNDSKKYIAIPVPPTFLAKESIKPPSRRARRGVINPSSASEPGFTSHTNMSANDPIEIFNKDSNTAPPTIAPPPITPPATTPPPIAPHLIAPHPIVPLLTAQPALASQQLLSHFAAVEMPIFKRPRGRPRRVPKLQPHLELESRSESESRGSHQPSAKDTCQPASLSHERTPDPLSRLLTLGSSIKDGDELSVNGQGLHRLREQHHQVNPPTRRRSRAKFEDSSTLAFQDSLAATTQLPPPPSPPAATITITLREKAADNPKAQRKGRPPIKKKLDEHKTNLSVLTSSKSGKVSKSPLGRKRKSNAGATIVSNQPESSFSSSQVLQSTVVSRRKPVAPRSTSHGHDDDQSLLSATKNAEGVTTAQSDAEYQAKQEMEYEARIKRRGVRIWNPVDVGMPDRVVNGWAREVHIPLSARSEMLAMPFKTEDFNQEAIGFLLVTSLDLNREDPEVSAGSRAIYFIPQSLAGPGHAINSCFSLSLMNFIINTPKVLEGCPAAFKALRAAIFQTEYSTEAWRIFDESPIGDMIHAAHQRAHLIGEWADDFAEPEFDKRSFKARLRDLREKNKQSTREDEGDEA
ncbi:hypothetical protein BGZ98_001218 [Dissophora globulifera]|nr:hypothetical protein BGZ98_001218 [Dissophora globulifera]